MLKKVIVSAAIISALFLSGCASVPMASIENDAKAKEFSVQKDKANIYIYRNESLGFAIKMPVLIDGMAVGDTAANTYVFKTVEPGKHTVVSKTEKDETLTIDTKVGNNYFIWQEVKMGVWSARSKLHLVNEEEGKKAVRECKLVK